MMPHQERVIEEKAQLDERLAKLEAFIGAGMVQVDEAERARLIFQRAHMRAYSGILGERINAWG